MRIAQDRPHPGLDEWDLPSYVQNLIIRKGKELSKRTGFRRYERYDIEHDLLSYALEKRSEYNPARGAGLATFLSRVIENRVRELIRNRGRLKRRAANTMASLDQTVEIAGGSPLSLGARIPVHTNLERSHVGCLARPRREDDQLAVSEAVSGVMKELDPLQMQVAGYLIEGHSDLAISRQLDISRRQVAKAIEQIKQALIQAGLDPSDANQ